VSDWGQGTGQCRKLPGLGTQDVPRSAALRALELHMPSLCPAEGCVFGGGKSAMRCDGNEMLRSSAMSCSVTLESQPGDGAGHQLGLDKWPCGAVLPVIEGWVVPSRRMTRDEGKEQASTP
jgi:hypothetical protein